MLAIQRFLRTFTGRTATYALTLAMLWLASGHDNWLYAVEVERARDARLVGIAAKLGVDPDVLRGTQNRSRFNFAALFDTVAKSLGLRERAAATSQQPLDVRESVARVKRRYALVAADAAVTKIAQLVELSLASDASRGKRKKQIKAELRSVLGLMEKDFLPAPEEGLPAVAKARDAKMRGALEDLRRDVKSVLNKPHALDEKNLDATLAELRQAVSGTLTLRNGKPRWTDDPFPVRDAYRRAPTVDAGPRYGTAASGSSALAQTPAIVTAAAPTGPARTSNAITSEVAALAAELDTPARIFRFVHDRIEWESYSGVAKGSLATLREGRGNDWDQALLLRDLLQARGYQSQIEWGKVSMPVTKAMNLAGTEDPMMAANLLATAGFDTVALISNGAPVAVQMTHAWVRAFIPYIPNRGTTGGAPDTWVRMDPSFKKYEYQPGIRINGNVPWSDDQYIRTSSIRPPADHYADQIWAYIRANNLECNNLAQVAKSGRIQAQNHPFVPATLNVRIEQLSGLAAEPPAAMLQSVSIALTDRFGQVVSEYSSTIADLWGRKLSLTFPPATADDAEIIARYGGLFNTPPYLVQLAPVFSIDDQPVATGSAVSAGATLGMTLTFRQPNRPADFGRHTVIAGETHAEVFDAGIIPESLIAQRVERLKQLTAANAPADAILSEQLFLTGLRYMQYVDDAFAFSASVRWQRFVKTVFEGDVRRQIDTLYNIVGSPVRLVPAENNIDVTHVVVGIVPIDSDLSNRADALALAGMQSSYLEGAIWEEMQSQQGISAVKALLLARLSGQQLHNVDRTNVDSILATVNLSSDVEAEIRGAVQQGRVGLIPTNNITLNRWRGTGYILKDTATGAATYPISGGYAGGSTTGGATPGSPDTLGEEPWLGDLVGWILSLVESAAGGGDSSASPSTTQGDPVNMSSGNMHRTGTDLFIVSRGIGISLDRTYNSRSTYNGPFGYGWTFSYGETLTPMANGSVMYRESDGTEHVFTSAGGQFVSPPGKHIDLTSNGSGWTMRFDNGAEQTFDAQGRLATQKDLNGNTVTINRDANGLPSAVVDASGRTALTFTVANGRIIEVTDLSGRKVLYGYDGDDLVSVTDTAGKTWTMEYDLGHNLTQFRDPLGNTQSYAYDNDDRLMQHVDAVGGEELFHYDIAGRQSVITDRRGGERLIEFDDRGRATVEADPSGNMVRASYDADNNPTALVDSRGNTTTIEYDANGNVTRRASPDGSVATATYDENSHLLTSSVSDGPTTVNTYDADGNLTESRVMVNGVAEITTYTYDADGLLLTTTDPNGGTTAMTWNANGSMATRTDAAGTTTTFTTDALGRITGSNEGGVNATTLTYDDRDRVLTIRDAHNRTITMTYDDAGRRTSATTPQGTVRETYDAEGRVLARIDAMGNKTTTAYNLAGDVVAQTDARGNTSRFEYDQGGRITRVTDPTGGIWTYGYCAAIGELCQLTDPNGNAMSKEFGVMGRVSSMTDSLGHSMRVEYDKAGRKLLELDANGNATRFTWDEAGRLLEVREASGAVTSFTYDRNGNKLAQKDANGNTWSFRYDALNRLIEEKDPLDRARTYTYDAIGNLKTKTDAKNQTITYGYDVRRLTSIAYPNATTESIAYDALGRRTSMTNANVTMAYTYDALNRVTSVTNQRYNIVARYEYDAAGNRVKLITPRSTAQYTYDAKNRLTTVNDSLFGAFRFGYDPMDRRTSLQHPNGINTTYAYDKVYRLTSVASKDGLGNVIDAWSYQYDAVGNPTAKTSMDGKTETYRYDDVYRLTEANYADGTFEKFTYDPAGNRTSLIDPNGTITYSYDVANQLLRAGSDTFTHDANGNPLTRVSSRGTTTYTWDFNDRLTNVDGPDGRETNLYSVDGMRVDLSGAPMENGQVRVFYDLDHNPILDWGIDNQTWTYRLYGPGMDEPLAEYRRINNRTSYLHRDGLGSVTAVSDTSGQVLYRATYSAFGKMSRTTDPQNIVQTRLGYASRETSVGGLMYNRARHYDTTTGRFLQQDTWRGEDVEPPSLHRYTYVHNNPVRYTDPTGHIKQEDMLKFVLWFYVLYNFAVSVVLVSLQKAGIEADSILVFGLELVMILVAAVILSILVDKAWQSRPKQLGQKSKQLLTDGWEATKTIVRTGGYVPPALRPFIMIPYGAVVGGFHLIRMMSGMGSGRGLVYVVRNLRDFWNSGLLYDLLKGKEFM